MSLMIQMLKKAEQDGVERLESTPGPFGHPHHASVPRRSSWSAWAGWGVAAVVVLFAGPVIVEKWYVKGNVTPVSSLADKRVETRPLAANLGTIHAVSEPPGAGVLLDGRFVGVTPLRFQWDSGAVTLTLKKNGFQDLTAPVQVDVAKEVDFRVTLQPETLPAVANLPKVAPPLPVTAAVVPAAAKAEAASVPPLPGAAAAGSVPVAAIPAGEDPDADAPLKLAGVIRYPPEVKLADAAKGGESARDENKPKKTAKSAKPSKAHAGEGEGATVPVQDVREIAKDPELASLLRQPDSSPSDQLNFAYSIQMSAYLDRDSAIRNAALWRKRGYDAYVLELWGVKDPTRLWQSVRVGRFNDLVKARLALEALRRQEKISGFYVARSDSFTPPEGAAPIQAAKIIPITGPDNVARVDGGAAAGKGSVLSVTASAPVADALPAPMTGAGKESAAEMDRMETAPVDSLSVTSVPLPLLAPTPRRVEAKQQPKPEFKAESKPEPKPEFK
ncbi:MAG: PEGA domain-containing protein, partial [Magnetococcales bacterium]|nr:PEGA domain-containing protein [Magnetococcales bacterium]